MGTEKYKNALVEEGRNLADLADAGKLPNILFRESEIERIRDALNRKRSILLVGPVGVGKTAAIHGLANSLKNARVFNLFELSTSLMMSGTKYLGEWESKVTAIFKLAQKKKAVLYINDVWNLSSAGVSSSNKSNILDAMRQLLSSGELQIIGEASSEILQLMERVPGFVKLFEQVPVTALSQKQIKEIISSEAVSLGLELDENSRLSIVELCARFLAASPGPGPALNLLRQIRDYFENSTELSEKETCLTPFLIEKIFSIYSGLPLFVVSRREVRPVSEIRNWFRDHIVGQQDAIEAVIETIALFKAGLRDPERPIGTFLFVGPTGVGKTELALTLAIFLFGSARRLLRFDLSEFKDYNAFEMLLGDPRSPHKPARLVDPVRAHPFQVILLDEIEKAHSNVSDIMLQLLDDGRLTPPSGQPVDFRNTIVIATTKVGSEESEVRNVGFGADDHKNPQTRKTRFQKALEQQFRAEFLNRFQNIVLFHPLSRKQVRTIARQELKRVLKREGITSQNLVVDVQEELLDSVVDDGYDIRYGARALKREIQRKIVLPLAMYIMEREVEDGSLLKISLKSGRVHVRMLETPKSREKRLQREPVRLAEGRSFTRIDLLEGTESAKQSALLLAQDVGEELLRSEQKRLQNLRDEPTFWSFPKEASKVTRDLDRANSILDRIDRLQEQGTDLEIEIKKSTTRNTLEVLARRMVRLETDLEFARRELVTMGKEGEWDALVEITPIGPCGKARELVYQTYQDWARYRKMAVDILLEPRSSEEPVFLAVQGAYAHGLLRGEAGLHRVRDGKSNSVVRVRVAAWIDERADVIYEQHIALKARGNLNNRIRSRLVVEGDLILQNGRTLAENRELAREIAPSWKKVVTSDVMVRRYDLLPFMIRDHLTGITTGRTDALAPKVFHEFLCKRLDCIGKQG